MSKTISKEDEELADLLIDRYRETIKERYQFEFIQKRFELSSQVNAHIVEELRHYFLDCLYPPTVERHKIDEAFDGLNSFISSPAKTWRILGNMTGAIFRFGTMFPKALKAGVASLDSYLSAKRFENELLRAAKEYGYDKNFSDEEFRNCMTYIPKKESEEFIEDIASLFESLTNTKLLKKTVQIMTDVGNKMKKNTDIYSQTDLDAIELGVEILQRGYDLFKDFPDSLKKEMIVIIRENEHWYLDQIYLENQSL